MADKIIYAVGTKGNVELRLASKPPLISSKVLTKTIKEISHYEPCDPGHPEARETRWYWDNPGWECPVYYNVRDRVPIVVVKGGKRLIAPISKRTFTKWTGHSLSAGTIWPLPKKMGEEVLKRARGDAE